MRSSRPARPGVRPGRPKWIEAALEFADNPSQRELLSILDADLVAKQGDAEAALAVLNNAKGTSRIWHQQRRDWLDRLRRKKEADDERTPRSCPLTTS